MPKHSSAAADLATEFARILDLESVRPVAEGHIAINSTVGDTITGEIIHAFDGSVIAKFRIDVDVP